MIWYVYGMTPRLFCSSSRLILFDHTVFEEKISKVKTVSPVKKAAQQSKRGRNSRKHVRNVAKPVALNSVVVEVKCVSITFSHEKVAQSYGLIVPCYSSLEDF
jgi:hypothetical protein